MAKKLMNSLLYSVCCGYCNSHGYRNAGHWCWYRYCRSTILSKQSDKEKSTDKPSWVNREMVDLHQTAQQNATNMLNEKYGAGQWKKGADSEYNKNAKWITRKVLFNNK